MLFVATGTIALLAVLLLLIGFVHLIASLGLAVHWSYMLLALVLLSSTRRAKASAENLIPKRAFAQLGETAQMLKDTIV